MNCRICEVKRFPKSVTTPPKKIEPKNLKQNSVNLFTKEPTKNVKTGSYCVNESNVNIINSTNQE